MDAEGPPLSRQEKLAIWKQQKEQKKAAAAAAAVRTPPVSPRAPPAPLMRAAARSQGRRPMQRVTPNYGRPHGSVPPAAGAKKRSATADLTSNTKVRAAEPAAVAESKV